MNLIHACPAWLLASVMLCASACNSVPAASVADTQPVQAPRLAIGESLALTDDFNAELNLTRPVDVDGTVLLPELGHVSVVGLTRAEIEALLRKSYTPYFEELRLYARILPAARHYYVFGDVVSEGGQELTGDMTIFEAVTKAQPRKDSANLGRVRLIRADPRDPFARTIDLQHMIETGDSTSNVHVQERDVIYVPAAEPKR
jgi:polysaccharide biosynthesis/export protein